jgi:hypothetical protein
MANAVQCLFDARAEAEARARQARIDLAHAEVALSRAAVAAFLQALAARGIVERGLIVIEGQYSAPWAGKVSDIRHGTEPVFFRGAALSSAPATRPQENSTERWWWFRVGIARPKKDGKPRDEYRNLLVHGDTPEAAAMQISAAPEVA